MNDLEVHVVERKSDIAIVRLVGSLNPLNADQFDDVTSGLYERGCRKIILACEFLLYISSRGLEILLKIARRSGMNSGLILCGVNRDIAAVLDLSGLLRCVLVYDDVSQARLALFKEEED